MYSANYLLAFKKSKGKRVKNRRKTDRTPKLYALISAILLIPNLLAAETIIREIDSPPDVSTLIGTPVIQKAYMALPISCRKELQFRLRQRGFVRLNADGRWSDEIAAGLLEFVRATGPGSTLVYNLQSVPGAKGLIWSIASSEANCPQPPYAS